MKILHTSTNTSGLKYRIFVFSLLVLFTLPAFAQDETEKPKEEKPARPAFESAWLLDGQSSRIYNHKTLEFVIQHRFGVVTNGISDLFGLYGPSNIRLGLAYAPIPKLNVAMGYIKNKQILDLSAKYGLLEQTRSNSMPVSVVYYVNMGMELRDADKYANSTDRFTYYHQLIIAKRFSSKISLQIAPSLIHYNAVEGFLDSNGELQGRMENDSFGVNASGKFKFSPQSSVIIGYDQPLTDHIGDSAEPSLSLGVEISTSSHAFQIFFTNFSRLLPQENYMFNSNDLGDGDWLIGFNITRLWSW